MGGRGSGSKFSGGANFHSVLEAQNALNKEGLFKYVSLMDHNGNPVVEVQTANAIYDMVHKIATEFPELQKTMYCISPEELEPGVYAHCHLHRGEINFDVKKFSNHEKLTESNVRDVKSGWSPAGTENPAAIIAHEMGHAIDGYLTIQKRAFGFTPKGNYKYASSAIRSKVMKAAGLKVSDVGKAVSRYAATDAKEWFAESFAEYVSSSNPRPAAAAFGKELRRILKNL